MNQDRCFGINTFFCPQRPLAGLFDFFDKLYNRFKLVESKIRVLVLEALVITKHFQTTSHRINLNYCAINDTFEICVSVYNVYY